MIDHLQPHCLPGRRITILGATIHFISCLIADPMRWSDPKRIKELLEDLNREPSDRKHGPWVEISGKREHGSAHICIPQDGTTIEWAPDELETWHAGPSAHKMSDGTILTDLNKHMKSYELIAAPKISEGKGLSAAERDKLLQVYGFKDLQYRALAKCLRDDMKKYGFGLDMITRHDKVRHFHNSICRPSERAPGKPDPGSTFKDDYLRALIIGDHDLDGG